MKLGLPYLIGCRDSDANLSNALILRVNDKDFCEAFISASSFFNKKPDLIETKGSTTYRANLCGNKIVSELKKINPNNFDNIQKIEYIRACFDGDGSVTSYQRKESKGYRNSINFSSSNFKKIKMWESILQELGIVTIKMWSYEKVNGKGLQYRIGVSTRKENILLFYNIIGTSLQRKNKIFKRIMESD